MTQPGIFTQLMSAAEERPWLWVIYLLTVGLPVGLLVLFCWPKVRATQVPPTPEKVDEADTYSLTFTLFSGFPLESRGGLHVQENGRSPS